LAKNTVQATFLVGKWGPGTVVRELHFAYYGDIPGVWDYGYLRAKTIFKWQELSIFDR